MSGLEILGVVLLFLVILGSIVTIVFGLPGTWIILLAAIVFSLFTGFAYIPFTVIIILFLMAAFAEGIEFLAVAYGAKKYGASRRASIAAIVGAILGAILLSPFLLIVGAVLGAFVGAFVAAFLVEYLGGGDFAKASRSGYGAFLGKLGGTIAKAAMGVAMAVVIVGAIF